MKENQAELTVKDGMVYHHFGSGWHAMVEEDAKKFARVYLEKTGDRGKWMHHGQWHEVHALQSVYRHRVVFGALHPGTSEFKTYIVSAKAGSQSNELMTKLMLQGWRIFTVTLPPPPEKPSVIYL